MGLLPTVETRASLENPSTSLGSPDAWLVDALGAGPTQSGVNVNHSSALSSAPVWACINVLAQDVAKLPLITYERLDRGKDRATGHRFYGMLHDAPNPQMSSSTFRKTLQGHVATWGNGYAEKERNHAGDVVALWPLPPDRTEVHRVKGEKVFVTRAGGRDILLADDDVLHIPGLGFDGLRGYSVISMARQRIGGEVAAAEYGGAFFKEGARPGGVIMRKDSLTEQAQDRLRKSWNQMHQGLSGAQRVAVLDEDMTYTRIGVPPNDAQFIETRQFSAVEICRFFRIPPHKIQVLDSVPRANIEAENISYVVDTLQNWLVTWEQEIKRSLFANEPEFFAEFQITGLLRGDSAARAEFYAKGIQSGWFSINDVREMENLNPVEGGDSHFVPLNLVPLAAAESVALGNIDPETDSARTVRMAEARASTSITTRHRLMGTHVRAFKAAGERVVASETKHIRGIIDKTYGAIESRSGPDFLADLRRFYEGFDGEVVAAFAPVLTAYGALIRSAIQDELGGDVPEANYERFVGDYTAGLARRHTSKGEKQLRRIVADTDPEDQAEALNERLDEWDEKRPGKLADSESTRAMGALSKAAYIALGILRLRWVTIGKNCPFCTTLNGRTVSITEMFASKGEEIEPSELFEFDEASGTVAPMEVKRSFGHPPAHSACDCVVSPGF